MNAIDVLNRAGRVNMTNPDARAELVRQVKAVEDARMQAAWARARAMGIPTEGVRPGGGRFVLRDFRGDQPVYHRDENVNAAISTAANLVRGTAPYNVDGTGWVIGLWEAGGITRVSHQEFYLSRAVVLDGTTTLSDHATHVAGTLIGAGYNPALKGMAPGGTVWVYSSSNDYSEMLALGAAASADPGKINLSNHSYGNNRGWETDTGRYVWYGSFTDNADPTDDVDANFGQYDTETATVDALAFLMPYYLPCISAGNHRGDSAPPNGVSWFEGFGGTRRIYNSAQHPAGDSSYKSGYDTMEGNKLGKNVLAVGAVSDAVSGGVRSLAAASITSFSSEGPADDGRIKPDVVANGSSLTSCSSASDTASTVMSGTSMASPNACGSALLLQQYYYNRFPGQMMRADLMKGLIIHTADDIGNVGPDYRYGWGLMNTKAAADVIKDTANQAGGASMITGSVTDNGVMATASATYTFRWDGTRPLRATLCWTDPAGTAQTTHDSRTRALVNDLNLSVQRLGGLTYRPYVMPYVGTWTNGNLSAVATTGVNSVDNVEQVYLGAPVAGDYTITVNYAGSLQNGVQPFALIVTGQIAAPDIAVQEPLGTDLIDGTSSLSLGSVAIGASSAPKTVWVANAGTANLNLTTIANTTGNPGDFIIDTTGTATLLAPGASTSFKVSFVPTASGARTTRLQASSNDTDENPFDITLNGSGVAADGDLTALSLNTGILNPNFATAIANYDAGVPSATSAITVTATARQGSASITINGAPATSGVPSGPVNLVVGSNTITIAVTANGNTKNYIVNVKRADGPEIVIEQPSGSSLVDGGSGVDFGAGVVGGAGLAKTFIVRNVGTTSLTGVALSKSGTNSADFSYTSPVSSTLAPNASTSFTVSFTAGASGPRTAALQVASSDSDENPFDIPLTGTGASPLAQMSSPIPGTPLSSTLVTFNWTAGTGVTGYVLWIGSTPDSYDLYVGDEGANRSRTVPLPDDGRSVYVTLWSIIGGVYTPVKYTYRALVAQEAQITSPANGSTLTSTNVTLRWSAGAAVQQYVLWVGSTPGGYDYYAGFEGKGLSRTITVPSVPGAKVYATLWSMIRGVYQGNSYIYTLATPVPAAVTSHVNGTTLTGSSVNLTWSPGIGVGTTVMWVGSAFNSYDLGAFDVTGMTTRAFTVPTDGGPVYFTLWSLIGGAYQSNGYWFNTALPGSGGVPARLTSHAIGSTASSTNVTLNWDAGTSVTRYVIWVGSTPDGYDLAALDKGTSLSHSMTLPGDGRRIYVTLYSVIGGVYLSNAYWFTAFASPSPVAAQIASPANGSTLGSASLPLVWNTGTSLTQYALWAGNAPSGYDIYAGAEGSNLSRTLMVPTDGGPVYVTLWSLINGAYQSNAYWFNTANLATTNRKARLLTPANTSALPSAGTTFTWDAGADATGYALWIGSNPSSYDVLAAAKGTSLTHVATMPTDGRKLYLTLWSLIGGSYRSNNYWFTAVNIPRVKAVITSPANGSTFISSSATFTWSAGSSVTNYALWIGRQPMGYDIYAGLEGTNTSKTITTLPMDGGPVYLTLWSLIDGAYQSNEYIFNAAPPP